jgi:hypothetical protein
MGLTRSELLDAECTSETQAACLSHRFDPEKGCPETLRQWMAFGISLQRVRSF